MCENVWNCRKRTPVRGVQTHGGGGGGRGREVLIRNLFPSVTGRVDCKASKSEFERATISFPNVFAKFSLKSSIFSGFVTIISKGKAKATLKIQIIRSGSYILYTSEMNPFTKY